MKLQLFLLLLYCLFPCALQAQALPLDDAIAATHADLRAETEALAQQRAEIAARRREVASRLRAKEEDLRKLREEIEGARRVRRQDAEAFLAQREVLSASRQREAERAALTRESRRALDSLLPRVLAPDFSALDKALEAGDPSATRLLLHLLDGLSSALSAPTRIPASILAPDGSVRDGQAILLGPLAWFRAHNAPLSGQLYDRESELPRLFPAGDPDALQTLFEEGHSEIAIDLAQGRALERAVASRSLVQLLRAGGLTMVPLGLTALAALLLTLLKTFALLPLRGRDDACVHALSSALRAGDPAGAAAVAAQAPTPLRELLDGLLAHPRADAEQLEEILHERMLGLLPRLDRHLGTLAVLGGIAPLLGLLGTVTGMITTFELVTLFGSGNERILSQGISEALVTTMTGLVIAVPVLLAHAFLSRRVRVLVGELEQSIASLLRERSAP